jgi:hypothetical protein
VSEHTPGPWTVRWSHFTHGAGSNRCGETCGKGQKPLSVSTRSDYEAECLRRSGHAGFSNEIHEEPHNDFEELLDSGGKVIFGIGQDYDDQGVPPNESDARLIAAAPEMADLLLYLYDRDRLMESDDEKVHAVLENAGVFSRSTAPNPHANTDVSVEKK